MELTGGVNGMTYHPETNKTHSELGNSDKEFSPYPMGLMNFRLIGDINDTMSYKIKIDRDNVLQNSVNIALLAKTDYFMMEFGPFVGVCDNFDIPDAGISGAMEVSLPGIFSFSLAGSTTIGSNLEFTSNNFREILEAKLMLWFPGMLLTGTVNTRSLDRYSEDSEGNSLIRNNSLTRFMLGLDFYSKSWPVVVNLEGGYQIYSRKHTYGNRYNTDEIKSYFGGLRLDVHVSESLKIITGLEIPFLITSEEPMTVTPEFMNLCKFTAGFAYTFHGKHE